MNFNNQKTKVRKECGFGNCTLPTVEYFSGEIIVYNEHHGKKHVNHIDVDWIFEQAILDGKATQIIEKLNGEYSDANK